MNNIYIYKIILSISLSIIGGILFHYIHIPLPWILGPVTFLLVYKSIWKKETISSLHLRNISFVLLGIQIGSTFTTHTFENVTPYFFPFLMMTLLLIFVGLFAAFLIAKYINLDMTTSILGAVPGGLSAMIALSESFKSNTVYVTIFHSIRLLAVLFIVPFAATHLFFQAREFETTFTLPVDNGHIATVALYFLFYFLAKVASKKVPASYVIVPMILTGVLNASGFTMYHLPAYFFIGAQILLGMYLGHTVSVRDIMKVGKYCYVFLLLNIGLIAFSFLLGYLFTLFTTMDLVTAILSFAPGGLVEMALTAEAVGGDPSIVSSLQVIRLLIIVILLPLLLQMIIPKLEKRVKVDGV
ncbi:hypothetical protein HNQ94_000737 [Salirhabdus euzebyi]|uniref:AbrB family transcriptional regulator n=1 Tax=Salirhabdus euzebyi TaxID=394506 RepID=A0A841Q1X1_9BACI|nr:AbrB family transcriptional regulator [Salirhabdus euzebyi]MBB6452292.1 hypothetical protein [Salirhabdus euzebyi]